MLFIFPRNYEILKEIKDQIDNKIENEENGSKRYVKFSVLYEVIPHPCSCFILVFQAQSLQDLADVMQIHTLYHRMHLHIKYIISYIRDIYHLELVTV